MAVGISSPLDQLDRSLAAVGELISTIRPEQWAAPTPCAGYVAWCLWLLAMAALLWRARKRSDTGVGVAILGMHRE